MMVRYQNNKYRRDAVLQIKASSNITDWLIILKQVAMRTYGREVVAPLSGENWYVFLDTHCKGAQFNQFQSTLATVMAGREQPETEHQKIKTEIINWVKRHVE
jgi:hypothetical protein